MTKKEETKASEEKKVKNVKATKKTKKKDKKGKVKKESYIQGVNEELKKVKWPSKKEVIKYTIATIVFVVILVVFFVLLDLLMSVIKGGI